MLTVSQLQDLLLEHAFGLYRKLDCFYTVSISDLFEMPFSDILFCINHYAQLSTISLGTQSVVVVQGDLRQHRIEGLPLDSSRKYQLNLAVYMINFTLISFSPVLIVNLLNRSFFGDVQSRDVPRNLRFQPAGTAHCWYGLANIGARLKLWNGALLLKFKT